MNSRLLRAILVAASFCWLDHAWSAPSGLIVLPASFEEKLSAGETVTRTMVIENLGASDVTFSIAVELEPGGARAVSLGVPLVQVVPRSGVIPAGTSLPLTLTFDASELAEGDYSSHFLVESNDPDEPGVVVPVSLTVTAAAVGHP
jgi:hypothetical protein